MHRTLTPRNKIRRRNRFVIISFADIAKFRSEVSLAHCETAFAMPLELVVATIAKYFHFIALSSHRRNATLRIVLHVSTYARTLQC